MPRNPRAPKEFFFEMCSECFTPKEIKVFHARLKTGKDEYGSQQIKMNQRTFKFHIGNILTKFDAPNFEGVLAHMLQLSRQTLVVHAVVWNYKRKRCPGLCGDQLYPDRRTREWRLKMGTASTRTLAQIQRDCYYRNLEHNRKLKRASARRSYYKKKGLPVPDTKRNWNRKTIPVTIQTRSEASNTMNGNRDEVPGPSGEVKPGYQITPDMGLGTSGTIGDGVPNITPLPNGSPIDVTNDSF